MIDELRPYPEYKNSGLPWLGKVPKHWHVRRLRHAVDMMVSNIDKHTKKGELSVRLCNYIDVYKNERITKRVRFMRATAQKDEVERFRLRIGDVVITKDSETWTDIGVPALVEYVAPDLVCGYHLAILRPRTDVLMGAFLLRAIQSRGVAAQFHVGANGVTRYGLSHADIKSTLIPLPPLNEQAAIVRFLDHANGKIERAIRAKRKLIALLNEQKQAIIHRAVTRGLDPAVKLKPSGIPWLGDVPEHWETARLGQWVQIERGKFTHRPRNDPRFYGGKYPFIQTGDISTANKFICQHSQTLNERGLLVSRLFKSGTLAMIITGAKTGHVAILDFDACFPDSAVALIPSGIKIRNGFLYYMCIHLKSELDRIAITSTQENLNLQRLRSQWTVWPPVEEQASIELWLDDELNSISAVETRVSREIALLREYRTTLTAEVVTGKLDVREAAKYLPAETEEPLPADDLPDDENIHTGEEAE